MTPAKRLLDGSVALLLMLLLAVPFALLLALLLVVEGRPLFYVAERMKAPGQPFALWKLRTMRPAAQNAGVSGGDKHDRVTHAEAHGKGRRTHGHSLAVAPWGEVLADAGTEPGVTLVDLDLGQVAQARHRVPSLGHDRTFEGP